MSGKVWVMHGRTESGDEITPYVFDFQPTEEEQIAVLKQDWPSEFEGDPEDWPDENFGYCIVNMEETGLISRE